MNTTIKNLSDNIGNKIIAHFFIEKDVVNFHGKKYELVTRESFGNFGFKGISNINDILGSGETRVLFEFNGIRLRETDSDNISSAYQFDMKGNFLLTANSINQDVEYDIREINIDDIEKKETLKYLSLRLLCKSEICSFTCVDTLTLKSTQNGRGH